MRNNNTILYSIYCITINFQHPTSIKKFSKLSIENKIKICYTRNENNERGTNENGKSKKSNKRNKR